MADATFAGEIHVTASTFDGREVFNSGHFSGPDLEGAVKLIKHLHESGVPCWSTAKGAPVDPKEVNSETIQLLCFEPATTADQ